MSTKQAKAKNTKRSRRAKAAKSSQATTRQSQAQLAAGALLVALTAFFVAGMAQQTEALQTKMLAPSEQAQPGGRLGQEFLALTGRVAQFEKTQASSGNIVDNSSGLEQQLSAIQINILAGQKGLARRQMASLDHRLNDDARRLASLPAQAASANAAGINVPILLYHHTPPDFDQQLNQLQQKGYSTITLDQLVAALHHTTILPAKPVIITFDDGFSDQWQAFNLLSAHRMVATFYIIDGGARSRWCIGAGRRPGDPLQPPKGCGDAYLNWSQIHQLDQSGLITIGSHTVDHEDLAADPPEEQHYQIFEGKQQLEAQLGHPVKHFAYPYGTFNATTLLLVQQAGFVTAVTTLPGTTASLDNLYTLHRVREVSQLP